MTRTSILLLALVGPLVAACGGDVQTETAVDRLVAEADGESATDPGTAVTLRSAVLGPVFDRPDGMSSARFDGTITVVGAAGSDLPGEFTMTVTGSFDDEVGASEVAMDLGGLFAAAAETEGADPMAELVAGFVDEPMGMVTIGDTTWIKWGLLAMFGVGDRWLESGASGRSMAAGFGIGGGTSSPFSLLTELAESDAEVEVVGTEEIRGVITTHHRAVLDVATLAGRMTDAQRAALEAELGASADDRYLLDLWLGDDDLIHRFELTVGQVVTGEGAGGETIGGMTMAYDVWDHGVDQAIAPPPADEVVTEAELGFSLEDLGALAG